MFSPFMYALCVWLLQYILVDWTYATPLQPPELRLDDIIELAGGSVSNTTTGTRTAQNGLHENGTSSRLLNYQPWPPPAQWPFRETRSAPFIQEGTFHLQFSNPGSVSDADQGYVGRDALDQLSDMVAPVQYPHRFSIEYPHRPRPWVRVGGILFGSRHFTNPREIYGSLFSLFEDEGGDVGNHFLQGRSPRPMTIDISYAKLGQDPAVPVAKIFFAYQNVPPYPRLGPPHLPQRRPFPNDRNPRSGLDFQLPLNFDDVVYRPRYGRVEVMDLVEKCIRSLAGRRPGDLVEGHDRIWERDDEFDLMHITYHLTHQEFTYGLLLQTLQTLYATVSVHGAFTTNAKILVRGQVWGVITM